MLIRKSLRVFLLTSLFLCPFATPPTDAATSLYVIPSWADYDLNAYEVDGTKLTYQDAYSALSATAMATVALPNTKELQTHKNSSNYP